MTDTGLLRLKEKFRASEDASVCYQSIGVVTQVFNSEFYAAIQVPTIWWQPRLPDTPANRFARGTENIYNIKLLCPETSVFKDGQSIH